MTELMSVDPDLPLRRHPEFVIRGVGTEAEAVSAPSGSTVLSAQGARVMAAFANTTTMREASARLATELNNSGAWMAAMDCIRACVAQGVLLPADKPVKTHNPRGFAQETQHIWMLNDAARTQSFIDAINATVRPDDIVLDIGTGTGVLAMAAARAGAAHVYAVEGSIMADVARAGVAANGLSDRVTVIHGHSTEITLPQLATVVVGEIIGDDPFDELILPTFADARRRLAAPGARFIPRGLSPIVAPLHLPANMIGQTMYTPPTTALWQSRYGFDFSWLLDPEQRAVAAQFERNASVIGRYQCGETLTMPCVGLGGTELSYEGTCDWPGYPQANALAVGFSCELADDVLLTTDPAQATQETSWALVVWVPRELDLTGPGRVGVTWLTGTTRIAFEPTEDNDGGQPVDSEAAASKASAAT